MAAGTLSDMNRNGLRAGASALALGILVATLGSFADNLLGDAAVVTVLQLVLWTAGGILVAAGAASMLVLRGPGARRPDRRAAPAARAPHQAQPRTSTLRTAA